MTFPRSTAAQLSLALAVLVVVSSCRATAPGAFDDTPVYAALVDGLRVRTASRDVVLLLEPSRSAVRPDAPLLQMIPVEAVARAFPVANREASQFSEGEADRLDLELFERQRFQSADGKLNLWWQDVQSHYGGRPVTIVRLTRPGFSDDGRMAVVYYGMACGGLCGETHLVLLEFRRGRWTVQRDRITGVS